MGEQLLAFVYEHTWLSIAGAFVVNIAIIAGIVWVVKRVCNSREDKQVHTARAKD